MFKSRWLDVLHRIRQGADTAELPSEDTITSYSPADNTAPRTFDSLDSESLRRKFEDTGKRYELTEEQEVELEAYIKQAHPELHERAKELYNSINNTWIALLFGRKNLRGSSPGDLKTTFQDWAELQQKKITLFAENTYKRLTAETAESTLDSLDSESQRGNSEKSIGPSNQFILSPDGPGKILWCSISWDRAAVVLRDDLVNLPAGSRPVKLFEWAELRPTPRAPPDEIPSETSSKDKVETGGSNGI